MSVQQLIIWNCLFGVYVIELLIYPFEDSCVLYYLELNLYFIIVKDIYAVNNEINGKLLQSLYFLV